MDWGCGRTDPDPCSGLCDADVLRAPQLQHSVQHAEKMAAVVALRQDPLSPALGSTTARTAPAPRRHGTGIRPVAWWCPSARSASGTPPRVPSGCSLSRADGAAIARDGRVSTPRDNPRLEEGQSLGKTGTIVTAAAGAIFEHMSLIDPRRQGSRIRDQRLSVMRGPATSELHQR